MQQTLQSHAQNMLRFVLTLFLFAHFVYGQDDLFEAAPAAVQVPRANDPVLVYAKRYLNVRRGLIKRTCELNEDEKKNLDSIEEVWFNKELAKGAQKGGIVENGVAMLLGRPARVDVNDAPGKVKRLQSLLDKKLFELLSIEHRTQVQAAIEEMERFECEASAQVLVSKMDEMFVLSAEQRDLLEPKLATWLKGKSLYMQFYMQNRSYLPNIPVDIVQKVLTSEQRKLFDATRKADQDYLTYQIQMFRHQPQLGDHDY